MSKILKFPSDDDRRKHALSLMVAAEYRVEHQKENRDDEACDDMLMAFRCIRRHMEKNENGKTFGSHSAYLAMQGLAE